MSKKIKNFREVMREFGSLLSDYRLRKDMPEVEVVKKMNHFLGENRIVVELFSKNDIHDFEHGKIKRDPKHIVHSISAFEKISGLDLKTLKEAAAETCECPEANAPRSSGKRSFGFGVSKAEILAAITTKCAELGIKLSDQKDLRAVSHDIRKYFGYSQRALARAIGELTPGGNGKYHSVTYRHLETDDDHRFSLQFKEALTKLLEQKIKGRVFKTFSGIGLAVDRQAEEAGFSAEIFTHNEDLSRMSPVLWQVKFTSGPAAKTSDPATSLSSIFFGLIKEALAEKTEVRTLESVIVPAAHAALEGLRASGIIIAEEEKTKKSKKPLKFEAPVKMVNSGPIAVNQ